MLVTLIYTDYTTLHYNTLTTLPYNTLHYTTLTTLYNTIQHYTDYTTLHYTTLHYVDYMLQTLIYTPLHCRLEMATAAACHHSIQLHTAQCTKSLKKRMLRELSPCFSKP